MTEAKEKVYEVIAKKYTGKHRVYKKGDKIAESEIFGSKDTAVNGMKGQKRRGKDLPEVKASLKLVTGKKKVEEKADDK